MNSRTASLINRCLEVKLKSMDFSPLLAHSRKKSLHFASRISWNEGTTDFKRILSFGANPSTPRSEGLGLPFDKLKAASATERLRADPEWRFFTPLKGGACLRPELRPRVRRQMGQEIPAR